MEPDLEKLENCVNELAIQMELQALPIEKCRSLINHVLYDEFYGHVEGKRAWESLDSNLITERELSNLVLAHAISRISSFNNVQGSAPNAYNLNALYETVELALFGRSAKLIESEIINA